MALIITISGTVENADLKTLVIDRDAAGNLVGHVSYEATVIGETHRRTATWVLSAAEKSAIATSLVPGAKAAIAADLGLV